METVEPSRNNSLFRVETKRELRIKNVRLVVNILLVINAFLLKIT